jgi:hypothetical protein
LPFLKLVKQLVLLPMGHRLAAGCLLPLSMKRAKIASGLAI